MKTTTIELETDENNQKSNKFQKSPMFAQVSFIISIISILFAILLSVIQVITQKPGIITLTILSSIILTLAVIGTIFGGLSFRDGKNVFGILGFTFNLIMIAYNIFAIYAVSTFSFC